MRHFSIFPNGDMISYFACWKSTLWNNTVSPCILKIIISWCNILHIILYLLYIDISLMNFECVAAKIRPSINKTIWFSLWFRPSRGIDLEVWDREDFQEHFLSVNSLLTSDHMDTVLIKGDRLNYFSQKSYGDLK